MKELSKSYLIAIAILLLSVIWVLSGVVFPNNSTVDKQSQSQVSNKTIMPVRVKQLKAEPHINHVVVTGRTRSSKDVTLKAELDGKITDIYFDKGNVVSEGDLIAKIDIKDRQAKLKEAIQRVEQRQIEYNAAKSLELKGFNSKIRRAQAEADLEAAKAEQEKAQIDLNNTNIYAPFSGVINDKFIEQGDFVKTGDEVFRVVNLKPIDVVAFVTEQQVLSIRLDSAATARLMDDAIHQGRVTFISSAADPNSRTYEVEITLPNETGELIEGMTVVLNIETPQTFAHKISPSILTLNDEGKIGVHIVDEKDMVQFYPIKILSDTAEFIWVGGLPKSVKVITVGQSFVIPGQIVKPVVSQGEGLL
jgi:multidrug efflux system membrane fusion protein